MDKSKEGTKHSRRDFLKVASTSLPAAAAAALAPAAAEAAPELSPTGSRVQDTAHTRAYYDSARF